MIKYFLLPFFFFSMAYASEPIMPELHALVLIGDPAAVDKLDLSEARGLQFYALELPGNEWDFRNEIEPLFLGKAFSGQLVSCLKEKITLYYRAHNRPVVAVCIPQQDLTKGVLQLLVLEGKVGLITVSGNRWFSSQSYKHRLRLAPGDPICLDRLLADLSWINRNPFRSVDACFSAGDEVGKTNIDLVVQDRFPLQFYIGGDNTGNSVTGHARWFGGFTWGNAFWFGHLLNYQYATASDPNRFQAHTVHYTMPLPWRHQIRAFGGYALVLPDMRDFHSKGSTFQSSLRYTLPYRSTYCSALHDLTVGFDFKNTNNNLTFIGEEQLALITQTINLTQFMLGYQYGRENASRKFGFSFELFWSPGKLVPNQNNARYHALSPHAKVKYVYGNASMEGTWFFFHRFAFFTQARFQLSNHTLLPSEQFGLGGYDTVRGYEEREFNADDALCINVELRSRPLSLMRYFKACKKEDQLLFLLFFDYGLGHLIHRKALTGSFQNAYPHLPDTEYLMSFGPGLRYNLGHYLSARCDWGIKLHRTIFGNTKRSMFHLGLVLSY